MADLDSTAVWAAVLLIALPLVIVGLGEVQERARQRQSPLLPVIAIGRNWVVPLAIAYAILRVVFRIDADALVLALVGTAALVSTAVAALGAVRIVVARLRARPRIRGQRPIPQLLLALPRAVVWAALIWLLLGVVWGADVSGALTALGVTSIVISLALQSTLGGLASGLLLLGDQPFQPGDWIDYGGGEGRVVDINWRSTRIENRDGDLVIVPNAELASATLINFDRPTRLHRVKVPVQVAFSNPPGRAKEMLLAAANATPGVLADPPPQAVLVKVDDPLMGYEAHLWVDDYARRARVFSDFGSLVWYWSERLDVPLPSPAHDLYLHDVAAADDGSPTPEQLGERLRVSPLLARLDGDEVERLASATRQHRFAAGEVIVRGPSGDRQLHVLLAGAARLVIATDTNDAVRVAELVPGDLFGIGGGDRTRPSLDAVAAEDCEVLIVDGSAVGPVASRNPALADALDRLATRRALRAARALTRTTAGAEPAASAVAGDDGGAGE